ncbi:hypothetical protein BJ875DRAFT_430577 [Amylocarpus encephaloides]|uniref:HOOK N-terminal domain-containing protein n=1 Tax=Amylocarpus encephaloides TaxID=45428 RepID=A0A9P7YD47_9HELO|nr:hypothetical protein BJ875DRAFT_430577 [Amylocarpus encephaloides]
MPTHGQKDTAAALLTWVNHSFPLDSKVERLADFSDGSVLSKMLEDIDPKYAVQNLGNDRSGPQWLNKKRSLETIHKSLQKYIRDKCDGLEIRLDSPINFNAIAENDDARGIIALIGIFLTAAMRGPSQEKYINGVLTLDPITQAKIADAIKKADRGVNSEDSEIPGTHTNDAGLALEAEHATLSAKHESLKKKHADMITRFEHLQFSYDNLRDHNEETALALHNAKESNSGDQTDYIKSLKSQLQEANELIESQEHQLENDRIMREKFERELRQVRPAANSAMSMQDELKELRADNANLHRKANTVDHYQKKLQAQGDVEKENQNLRRQIGTLEANQKDFDRVYEQNAKLETTTTEYQHRFEMLETNVVELGNFKKILEEELRQRDARITNLTEGKAHDERFISDLQEQLQIRTHSPVRLSPELVEAKGLSNLNLEDELSQSRDPSLELSRFKAEIQLLKSQASGTNNSALRLEIEELQRKNKRLDENLRDFQEKYSILQMQMNAFVSKLDTEKLVPALQGVLDLKYPFQLLTDGFYRDEAVAKTRNLYLEAAHDLSICKAKLTTTQAELTSRDREYLAAKADPNRSIVDAIDQDEASALEDLKATNDLITTSFQQDLLLAQGQLKDLIIDFEQQKSHLLDAFVAKDKANSEIATLKDALSATPKPETETGTETQNAEVTPTVEVQKTAEVRNSSRSWICRMIYPNMSLLFDNNPQESKTIVPADNESRASLESPLPVAKVDEASSSHLDQLLDSERAALGISSPRIIVPSSAPSTPQSNASPPMPLKFSRRSSRAG